MSHCDYYEWAPDALDHNTALAFPLHADGDSWVGALCSRHAHEATARFGSATYRVRCEHPSCPAQCAVCNCEFQPREAVASHPLGHGAGCAPTTKETLCPTTTPTTSRTAGASCQ